MISIIATLAFAASTASAAYAPPPTPSLIPCNATAAAVACPYMYKMDPKVGGVLRCKPRVGSTQTCSTAYCCVPKPEFVPCDSKLAATACPYSSYKRDPKDAKLAAPCRLTPILGAYSANQQLCNAATCCAPPPSLVSCSVAVKCAVYNKDPKNKDQVMRCKPRASSSMTCNEKTCCAPTPIVY